MGPRYNPRATVGTCGGGMTDETHEMDQEARDFWLRVADNDEDIGSGAAVETMRDERETA